MTHHLLRNGQILIALVTVSVIFGMFSIAHGKNPKSDTPSVSTDSTNTKTAPATSRPVVGSPWEITLAGGVKMTFQPIPTGTFTMGSPSGEKGRWDNETQHEVTISQPFWLGKTEVTQAQWEAIMGKNPSHFKGRNRPVETVSWNDAMNFCRKLTEQERAAGRLPEDLAYTLPTEAQWEYACRAGTTTPFSFGSVLNGREANCNGNSPYGTETEGVYLASTSDAGSYKPNAWGLHDMHGNVSEWCSDWYDAYPAGAQIDPLGASYGSNRVPRGGNWNGFARRCRSANRYYDAPSNRDNGTGLRVALLRAAR